MTTAPGTDHVEPTTTSAPRHDPDRFRALQQANHGVGHDYADGSPHIRHHSVRSHIADSLQCLVRDVLDRQGACRVLEIGAGHGTFTDYLVAAGARVVVTEMSPASVDELQRRFRHNDRVEVVPDPDGSAASAVGPVDVVACISVLHHIPDYSGAVAGWTQQLRSGGAFVSFQDPLWYPRRSWLSLSVHRAAYLTWRIPRGQLRRGFGSVVRRARRAYDESQPSDMVEFHTVRDGVDEMALVEQLVPDFDEVRLQTYWSTQGAPAQFVGCLLGLPNTFGIVARNRRRPVPPNGRP